MDLLNVLDLRIKQMVEKKVNFQKSYFLILRNVNVQLNKFINISLFVTKKRMQVVSAHFSYMDILDLFFQLKNLDCQHFHSSRLLLVFDLVLLLLCYITCLTVCSGSKMTVIFPFIIFIYQSNIKLICFVWVRFNNFFQAGKLLIYAWYHIKFLFMFVTFIL